MMKLTPHAIGYVRKQIAEAPLEPDELRRVAGLGNVFICLSRLPVDEAGQHVRLDWRYWFLHTLRIDDVDYYFYRGTPEVTPDSKK